MITSGAILGALTAAMTLHGSPTAVTPPPAFVANHGQWETPVRFATRRGPVTISLEPVAVVVELSGAAARMTFENARPDASVEGERRRRGRYNFLLGSDPDRWRAGVPGFDSVRYRGLYDGIDVRVRDHKGRVEYDLIVDPGADLSRVTVRCTGVSGLEIADDGALVMHTAVGPIRQTPPVTWHELVNGERRSVASRFCLVDNERFGFEVPRRDGGLPLVVDPGLEWSSFVGGAGWDRVTAVDADDQGILTIGGTTASFDFPATPGAFDDTHNGIGEGWGDGFVARFDPRLPPVDQLVWATFLGGSNDDSVNNLIVGDDGVVNVSGWTLSDDFPTTAGAFDESFNGGSDVFAARLDASGGTLLWSTYLGGSAGDFPQLFRTLAVDAGLVAVLSQVTSSDLPTTTDAFDASYNGAGAGGWGDAHVAVFDPTMTGSDQLVYASYLGGSGDEAPAGIAFDAAGTLVLGGFTSSDDLPATAGAYDMTFNGGSMDWPTDGFVARIDAAGNGAGDLLYLTYLGGTAGDGINSVAVDESGIVTVTGSVESADFPTTNGAYDESFNGPDWDAFVSRLSLDGNGAADLVYSTYLGGSVGFDYGYDLVVDGEDRIIVTGTTLSSDFPTTMGGSHNGGSDAFVVRLVPGGAAAGDLADSTLLGGSSNDPPRGIDVAVPGRVAVAGQTFSSDFPMTFDSYDASNAGAWDGYVAVLNLCMADLDGDGTVGITDLLDLLAAWGPCGICPPTCAEDLDEDCAVGITDLLTLLAAWGPCE